MRINRCQDACIYVIPYIIKFQILRIIKCISNVKIHPLALLWPYTNPGDPDVIDLKYTLPRNVFTQVTACMDNWFLKKIVLKIFLFIFPCKNLIAYCSPTLFPGSRFEHTWIVTNWECSHTSNSFSGQMVLEKIKISIPM